MSSSVQAVTATTSNGSTELLNPELSLLAFQRRVLALAQDASAPLMERLRFLGIVTSNIDELYMLHMAELRRAAVDGQINQQTGEAADAVLAAVEREVTDILSHQAQCAQQCLHEAAAHGVQLVGWDALTDDERAALRQHYVDEIQRDLMSHNITLSPGYPLPSLPHLGLFVAVVFRDGPNERARLFEHELPHDVPRLLAVPGRSGTLITIEEVLRANIHSLHPTMIVESTHLFRVTRGGDLHIKEDDKHDLLDAIAYATTQRPLNPAVRVEVERAMPASVGALILESLRREAIGRDMEITVTDVQVVDGLLDLRCLSSLPLPRGGDLEFPPLQARTPIASGVPLFDAMRERDLLMQHPFDAFDDTVVRFFQEAAADPQVTTISATLYRVGNPSPIAEALVAAATAGKKVFALVELQARFDEEHNVHWARALERAGGHVVYGLKGLKVHAKAALVVRQEGDRAVRYAHVGTGNYNTRSGKAYTDFSLFSTRDALAGDIQDLFASLSGAPEGTLPGVSRPPQGLTHGALAAPFQLLPALLERIEREATNALAGKPAHIAIKVNGLADTEVVRALYHAAQAGVKIDLIVRGICTLRPNVVGQSDNIRVLSVVGRFLEHSRIYRFANGGTPEYFIGSSDLRPRNLRRRVELLVPVIDANLQAQLGKILEMYLNDPTAWELRADGTYESRPQSGRSAQQQFALAAAAEHNGHAS